MRFLQSCAALAALAIAAPASATVTTIDFTSSGVPDSVLPNGGGAQASFYELTNSATGDPTFPAFTVNVGDELKGTVTFAQPLTLGANVQAFFDVFALELDSDLSTISSIDADASLRFFSGGIEVTQIGSPQGNLGSDGAIGVAALGVVPSNGYSFDSIGYDFVLTGLYDQYGQALTSGTIAGEDAAFLSIGVSAPEPSVWALMILGFGAVGMALRRRARALIPA